MTATQDNSPLRSPKNSLTMGRKRSATPDIEGNEEQVKGTGKAARKIVKGEIKAKVGRLLSLYDGR